MGLTIKTDVERSAVGPALCGAVVGSMTVMVHEVYVVFFGTCLSSDPFTHALGEMAVLGLGGAIAFAAAAHIWSRLRRTSSPQRPAKRLPSDENERRGGLRLACSLAAADHLSDHEQ